MNTRKIRHISVIGTGMIGASLAVLFTGNGYKTTMYAINESETQKGQKAFDTYYQDLVSQGILTQEQAKKCSELMNITTDYKDIADTDFVFECVFEKLEVKHSVYKDLEKNCKEIKVIASSTSAISVEDLAKGAGSLKDKLLVAHPWNPPHLVPFVEIVKGKLTSDESLKILVETLESTGRKVAVLKKSVPGFIANRLQHALYREAVYMVEQGITTPEDIDMALKYSFVPRYTSIGIFEHFDYAGLDMVLSIEDYLFPTLCNAYKTQDLVRDLYEAGNLGVKTGIGVYDWSKTDIVEFRKRASKPYWTFFNWNLPE